jgi:hypothetical protein
MSSTSLDKETRVLFIFLYYPGGLKFMELWKIVKSKKICARATLKNILEKLTAPPSLLLEKDQDGNYTLGLPQPISQLFIEGCSEVSDEIDEFLEILFKAHDPTDDSQKIMFFTLGRLLLQSRISRMALMSSILFPFLFDSKIRKVWQQSEQFMWDTIYQKLDKMSEKFYNVKITSELAISRGMDEFILNTMKEINREMVLVDKQMLDLITKLNIANDLKIKLLRVLVSKPLIQAILKEEKTITRILRALNEGQKKLQCDTS